MAFRLEAAWHDALSSALSYCRALLSSSTSSAWKPVSVLPLTESSTAHDSGGSHAKGSSLGPIHANEVIVHRRSGKAGEIYRATVEVDCGSDVSVDTFRGCLATPEARLTCTSIRRMLLSLLMSSAGDRMVESAETMDLLDAHTRVTKTNYRLGWPSR